ncbi:unnamed protein product [Candida verbasci]|uniref:Sporulation-specific protein SPO7 n=1 Tax=Candida verbasci TaxID=1227364 RepID=A0A9W4TTT7_9ASCO|nr:unnamed protein product [Candida verbasci]
MNEKLNYNEEKQHQQTSNIMNKSPDSLSLNDSSSLSIPSSPEYQDNGRKISEFSSNSSILNDNEIDEENLNLISPPKSPRLTNSSTMKLINSNKYDDNVIFSDSDELASQSSLDLQNTNSTAPSKNIKFQIQNLSHNLKQQKQNQSSPNRNLSSDEDDDLDLDNGEINLLKKSISNSSRSKSNSCNLSTPKNKIKRSSESPSGRRSSSPDTDSITRRKKNRRKSKEPSEKSHKSNEILGSGYTSMPASGKVFRNLLILEESLREQVIQQKAMRRKYLTFLTILCSIIAALTHYLFISNSPTQGTTRVILQFFLLATIITLMLYHLSGEYQKTIVLPRKFLSSTNKGLRQLNIRLVKIKLPIIDKVTDTIREILSSIIEIALDGFHKISPNSINNKDSKIEIFLVKCKAQCQPRIGVTDVKLVLNARVFNTDIRESWEMYRSEFWINEGVRRRNHLLNFINQETAQTTSLDNNKIIKRRKRKSSSIPSKLSEQNLQKLSNETESAQLSFPSSPLKVEVE